MQKVLVTGGCGYIGSHTIVDLIDNGFEVISIDNLINSERIVMDGIEAITGMRVRNYEVDLADIGRCREVFDQHADIAGIVHFAALKAVGESVEQPLRYYENNLCSLLNVLRCLKEYNIRNFIFSSSCSVYGNAKALPVTEETEFQEAESPYARTKQMGEHITRDFCKANSDIRAILLRYFNPAGAHETALIGEDPKYVALNLVPAITELAIGKRREFFVHGADYPTRDGSCIRDYIHVMDLANAHTKALQYLLKNRNQTNCEVFNLGIGQGVTVMEAIQAFERVTGRKLDYKIGPRRPGDVVAIYSDYRKAAEKLHWQPSRNIDDIMRSAWEWEQKKKLKSSSV